MRYGAVQSPSSGSELRPRSNLGRIWRMCLLASPRSPGWVAGHVPGASCYRKHLPPLHPKGIGIFRPKR
jgi:hypothetical protein